MQNNVIKNAEEQISTALSKLYGGRDMSGFKLQHREEEVRGTIDVVPGESEVVIHGFDALGKPVSSMKFIKLSMAEDLELDRSLGPDSSQAIINVSAHQFAALSKEAELTGRQDQIEDYMAVTRTLIERFYNPPLEMPEVFVILDTKLVDTTWCVLIGFGEQMLERGLENIEHKLGPDTSIRIQYSIPCSMP